ncbi:MAG: hypothetical protein KJ621_04070 [Proteobacteria bacterium]|nr:hypothetical protein [Pseudomonadota bacterium]MBU1742894.1 hypothetical protein [Pseudomonadota bacterium]
MMKMMNRKWSRYLVMPLTVIFLAATLSCGGMTSQENTAEGQALESQTGIITRSVLGGAVVGAVVGGLVGLLVSGGRAQGALIGAAAGAALGAGAGYLVGKAKKRYARAEDRLDYYARTYQEENQRLADYNETARKVVAQDTMRLATLRRRLAARRISRDQARADVNSARGHLALIDKALANVKKKLAEARLAYRDVRNTAGSARLRGQIERYSRAVSELSRKRRQLARAIASAPELG